MYLIENNFSQTNKQILKKQRLDVTKYNFFEKKIGKKNEIFILRRIYFQNWPLGQLVKFYLNLNATLPN